jgi:hypothetical protein
LPVRALPIYRLAVRVNALGGPVPSASGSASHFGRKATDLSGLADGGSASPRAATLTSTETVAETEPFLELRLALEFSPFVYWRDMLHACFEAHPALPERLATLGIGTAFVLLTIVRRRCFQLL